MIDVKKRAIGYFLSAASVYLAINYLVQAFLQLLSNFSVAVI